MATAPETLCATADFGAEQREVLRLPAKDGHHLGATLHIPIQNSKFKIQNSVLLLPGWSGPRTGPAELLVFLAIRLAAVGHTVLRLDFHGRGDSNGRFEECDLDRMISDAACGFDFLQFKIQNSKFKMVVGGICSGSNVALGLAALKPNEVHAVAALSALPFQPARSENFERRRRWKNLKQYASKALQPATWAKLARGEVNVERVKKNLAASEKQGAGERNRKDSARDIESELLAWKGRALFVWGSGDEEAAPAQAHFERLHAAGCAASATFESIPDANHNFYGQVWREKLAAKVLAFAAL